MSNLEFTESQLRLLKGRIDHDVMELKKVDTTNRKSLERIISRALQNRRDLLDVIETKINVYKNADSQATTSKIKKGSTANSGNESS